MSVETNSVPPWKLALLERKRRQEDDRRRQDNEGQNLSQMPAWKREILFKKQQQKNSKVYLRKPRSPDRYSDDGETGRVHSARNSRSVNENDVPNISVEVLEDQNEGQEVHIVPITKNPLVKNDPNFKTAKQSRNSWLGGSGSNSSHSNTPSHSNSWGGATDGQANRNSATIDDDVFTRAEEEVTYGRGFVHKLLQRFSHYSTKEDGDVGVPVGLGARRSSSTENILEGRLSPGYHTNGKAAQQPNRARSTDNLLSPGAPLSPAAPLSPRSSVSGDTTSITNDSATNSSHLSAEDETDLHDASIASNDSVVEELPKRNTVRTARSVFESITTHPASPADSSLAKPKFPAKPLLQQQQPEHGKYYNDTLSRKSGVHAVRHDSEPSKTEDVTDHVSVSSSIASPTRNGELPLFPSSSADSVVKPLSPQAARKPQVSNSWSYSGSKDTTADASGPKKSFLYPASKPSQDAVENNREPVLTNGTAAKPPHGLNGDTLPSSSSKNEHVLHIENNLHESNTDAPVINNVQRYANNRNETTTTSKKPDHNRLNLNLQLDTSNGTSPHAAETATNDDDNVASVQSLNLRNKLKKTKRAAPSGPGSMLIRPASNLVTGTKTEYLKLTSYTDVRKGEFAPAKKRVPVDSDDDDVPVTNIDDVLDDDIPVTDIDNLARRSDANDNLVKKNKWDFAGGNVSLSKNLLVKTRYGKRNKLTFEAQTTMFEYPCEQLLMDTMPPEAPSAAAGGAIAQEADYGRQRSTDSVSSDDGSEMGAPPPPAATLGSNSLGVGQSAGSLASYRSKLGMDYELGQRVEDEPEAPVPAPPPAQDPHGVSITPADEDTTWSDNTSADLLF